MKTDAPYRVLIVEDQEDAYAWITHLLTPHNVTICGRAGDLATARRMLETLVPDLVFLDVVLPDGTCFDLLRTLHQISFKIIFTTSHDAYAVKAFRLSAIDYLLKPVDPQEFESAMHHFYERTEDQPRLRNLVANTTAPEASRIALPTLTGYHFLVLADIIRCEADGNYTNFFTRDKQKLVVSRTLRECEQLLAEYRFFRVHTSHLVNLEQVTEYQRGEGGSVVMTDGSVIDVSRRRKEEFLLQLRKL